MSVTELFGRYHRLIRELASRGARGDAWQLNLRHLLQRIEDDRQRLGRVSGEMLRHDLSRQLEHELLLCTDPSSRTVFSVVLKHLEAET